MSFLDSHVHLWDTDEFTLAWMRPELGLCPQYLPADFREAAAGWTTEAVVVQGGESLAEANWLLAAARQRESIRTLVLQFSPSGVGWAGVVHPAVADADTGAVAGLRVPARRSNAALDDVPGFQGLCEGLVKSGRVLELLIRGDQLPAVAMLARDFPDLRIVVDHAALGGDEPDGVWRKGISRLSGVSNVATKVSGLFSGGWAPSVISHLLAEVPSSQLMVGSDWPMSTRVAPYSDIMERTRLALSGISDDEARNMWRRTAERIYLRNPRDPSTVKGSPQ